MIGVSTRRGAESGHGRIEDGLWAPSEAAVKAGDKGEAEQSRKEASLMKVLLE
jgi:hypothetical protein